MERNFAKLHEDVCFRRAGGKIIWQPRIGCWMADKLFQQGCLPGRYRGMREPDLFRDLDCSARIYHYNQCFHSVYDDTVRSWSETRGNLEYHYMETPVGTVSQITQGSPNSYARLTVKQWVEDEEDLRIYTYIEKHTGWEFHQEDFNRLQAEWGNLGAPTMYMPRTSVQKLYIDLMGVEEAVYALYDYPDLVEVYFDALRESQFRLIDVINASPVNIVDFGDNVHSGTLSPELFKKYVLPEYQMRCERLHRAGKFVCAHFDGDNRGLTQYYQQTGLDGIEAVTPLPQGDVTLEEVRQGLGDRMFLLDGIPAVYFDDTYSEETLIECVHKIIDLFAPNLILGISDEISSTGDVERIRKVGQIVDAYNAQFDK